MLLVYAGTAGIGRPVRPAGVCIKRNPYFATVASNAFTSFTILVEASTSR
jgi:hypothetical protein